MMKIIKIPYNNRDNFQIYEFPINESAKRIKEILDCEKTQIFNTRLRTGIKDRDIVMIADLNAPKETNKRACKLHRAFPFKRIHGDALICAVDYSAYARSFVLTGLTAEEHQKLYKILKMR